MLIVRGVVALQAQAMCFSLGHPVDTWDFLFYFFPIGNDYSLETTPPALLMEVNVLTLFPVCLAFYMPGLVAVPRGYHAQGNVACGA